MKMDYMKYDRVKLTRCADMVKAYIAISKSGYHKKADYSALAMQLKQCYDYAEKELNSALFYYDTSLCRDFVNAAFKYKDYKRAEIEKAEHNAVKYICNELNEILYLINHEPEKYEKCAEY